jgi:hypothetical protein
MGIVLGLIAVVLFGVGLTRTAAAFKRREPLVLADGKPPYILLALWIMSINAVFIVWALMTSPGISFFQALERIWYNTIDANNYAEIADHWYFPVEGSQLQYKIAFFPLYPVLMKGFWYIVRSMPISGMILSSACAYAVGLIVYKIARLELGDDCASSAVRYLFILPSAFFLMAPMTESLYLLPTAAFFLALIKKKRGIAAFCAFLAATSRPQGVLFVIPFAVEMIAQIKEYGISKSLKYFPLVLSPLVGMGCYLLINFQVYGDPLYFMSVQSQHWGNSLSPFWHTPVYLAEYLQHYLESGDTRIALGLSVPNLLAFFGGLGLIVSGAKRLRPSLTLYSLAYFAMSFGISWLLSGPRYLCCLFPVAIAAARVRGKGRGDDLLLSFVFFVCFVAYIFLFMNRFYVY